jgi:hypothetical protein
LKSPEEIRHFFDSELLPILQRYEKRRAAVMWNVALAGGLAVLLVVASLVLFRGTVLAVAGMVGLGLGVWAWSALTGRFVTDFKAEVIPRIAAFSYPGLAYQLGMGVSQATFREGGMFQQSVDRYRAEDFFSGTLGVTAIRFSEVHAEYKTETTDSKGRRHTQWHTIFKGLYVVADFNKHFRGMTVVLPDLAERMFGFIGQKLQEMNLARADLVKLEDPEFEKAFVVYAQDQVEARYILSPSLMRRILEYKAKTGSEVCLSFVGSRVHVAVKSGRDMWEPRVFRSLLDIKLIEQFVADLELAAGVVEDLNLNTRIWTKE